MSESSQAFRDLRIVFMGTPEFAVASLKRLVEAGAHIVGVVTAPDKPAGRGMTLQQSAVKQYAISQGLTVLQPDKLKNPAFIESLRALRADVQVVVAFRMLPEIVWNMPRLGTINVHGSLLPDYRGAAPINWAIINGEKETGVTTFRLQHEIDTGNIILQKRIPISDTDTAGTVHDRMKEVGADLLLETMERIAAGNSDTIPQESITEGKTWHHAPKIFTETCQLDLSKTVKENIDLIRGLSPYPAAFTFLDGKKLKIYQATDAGQSDPITHGKEHATDGKTYLRFRCADGWLQAEDLQLEGKKRMMVTDFLRGYRFSS